MAPDDAGVRGTPVPAIDIAPFLAGDPAGAADVVDAVGRACRDIGFLTITGHGVPDDLVSALQRASKAFFDLPFDEKMKTPREAPAFNRGYGHVGGEGLGRTLGATTASDYKESFSVGPIDPPDDPYFTGPDSFPHFAPNRWPDHPPELQALMARYWAEMERLGADIMRIFASALGLDPGFFEIRIDKHCSAIRLIHYPEQVTPPEAGQIRAGAHTDYGSLTILKTEDAPGGLEVMGADGAWHPVQVRADAFVINIGDLMAHWTNDRWRSTLHRVVNPPEDKRLGSRRLSIVFFHQPNYDAVIDCLPTCQGPDDPPRHPPVTSGEWRLMKLNMANQYQPGAVD